MKTRSESTTRPGSKGSTRAMNGSGKPDASPDRCDCPREQMVAEAAYYRAEQRGFAPGNEMSDWLQAEADVAGLRGMRG